MTISVTKEGRNLLVKITGDVDHHTSEEIRETVDREYNRARAKNIVFDLSGVSFMDSSGIGMIIGRYKMATEHGGAVRAACMSMEASRIFNISGLQKIIKSYDDIGAALEGL